MPESRNHSQKNFLKNYFAIVALMATATTTMAKSSNQLFYFILTKDNKAEKKTKAGFKTKNETIAVLKGSLWYVDDKEFLEMNRRNSTLLHSAECKDLSLTCELQDITKLTFLEYQLLFALTTCKERDALHSDNRRFMEVTRLYDAWKEASDSDGSYPRVEVRDERLLSNPVSGTLKYVDKIPSKSGFWFGIDMDLQFRNREISNTDGTFDNRVFFTCVPGCGLLVTANKVFAKDAGKNLSSVSGDRGGQHREQSRSFIADPSPPMRISPPPEVVFGAWIASEHASETRTNGLPRPEVEIGDRVVWYDDKNDQQLATVRWIGILRDKPDQYTIGVENDKPVGNGTGMHNNEQLFVTKPNYASLIPVVGLLKAEVVYGSRELVPPPPNASRESFSTSMTARSPIWREGVTWPDNLNQPMPFLHSQSDSGAQTSSQNARLVNRPLFSASYDQIPSFRVQVGNQLDRINAAQRISSSLAGNEQRTVEENSPPFDYNRLRDRLLRGDRHLPEVPPTDVTDVLETGATKERRRRDRVAAREGTSEINEPPETLETHLEPMFPAHGRNQPNRDFPAVPQQFTGANTAPLAGTRPVPDTSGVAIPRGSDGDSFVPIPLDPSKSDTELDIGSMVEVDIPGYNELQYGVIRWMGYLKEGGAAYAGVELENENPACTDGTFKDVRLFNCAPKKGFFTNLGRVRRDKRFAEASQFVRRTDSTAFGSMECDEILGVYAHLIFETTEDLNRFFEMQRGAARQRAAHPGRNMGIQGHHNSCYLDTTLFSMFAFSSAFDSILHREMAPTDIKNYNQIQRALRDGIVNPLRCQMFVRADKVLHLRQWLSQCSNIQGFMDEEKDPDEFLISLLQETMKAEPFIKFSSGHSGFCYQLFVDKDEKVQLPTTQQLLSLSLFQSDIKLVEVPRCLILQMPRFGKDFQMYQRIVPSLTLDITNMLQHDPQPCCFCGKLASSECRDCFLEFGKGFDRAYFCKTCILVSHSTTMRQGHNPKALDIYPESNDFYDRPGAPEIRSEVMDLFAVICIKTSHYVTFTKCGSTLNAPWVFFDSMADRIGQQHGHNVPQIESCSELPAFLMEENRLEIVKCTDDKNLPERMRRLLCDGYICMYQSHAMEPYR